MNDFSEVKGTCQVEMVKGGRKREREKMKTEIERLKKGLNMCMLSSLSMKCTVCVPSGVLS